MFSPFQWLRDAHGIRKDVIDAKKSQLEVEKLEEDRVARNLITKATMEDVKKYDPKFADLERNIIIQSTHNSTIKIHSSDSVTPYRIWVKYILLLGLLTLLIAFLVVILLNVGSNSN